MSAEKHLPSGASSSPLSKAPSERSTQTLSSEGEDTDEELDEESPQDELLFTGQRGSVEEEEYPEEEESLEEEKFLEEEYYLKRKADLFKEEALKEETHVEDKEYPFEKRLEQIEFKEPSSTTIITNLDARSSAASTFQESNSTTIPSIFTTPAPASVPAMEFAMELPSCCLMVPTSSLRHQSSQTEWTYEGKSSKSKLKTEPRISILSTKKSDLEVAAEMEKDEDDATDIYKKNFWETLMAEQEIDNEEVKDFDENFFNSSYQAVFNIIMKEIAARKELEEDLDIPLTELLESENRGKLAILLKKNFEMVKDAILLLMKRREVHLATQPKDEEEPEEEVEEEVDEVKKHHRSIHHHPWKKIELDKEWIQNETKVHQGDGKLIFYSNENIFQIFFPNGTGQIQYPLKQRDAHIDTDWHSVKKFKYIILEDNKKAGVRALINNSGHATFYDENGDIWLSLSSNLGHYFPKGGHQKVWNSWDLSIHVHVPPIKCISLKIKQYIQVQVRSQDQIIFCFFHEQKRVRLNLGTKYKFINPEVLSNMKKRAVLEVEPGPTAWKIQILLGKMSRILNFLTIPDLENFIKATTTWVQRRVCLTSGFRAVTKLPQA